MIPSLSVKPLQSHGIIYAKDLFKGNIPYSLEELVLKYHLPSQHQFTCVRLLNFIAKYPPPTITWPPKIWDLLTQSKHKLQGISLFYNTLQDKQHFHKSGPMLKWESNLHASFSPAQWPAAFNSIARASHCTNYSEVMIKITNRWYYMPFRLAKIFLTASPMCWCEFGQVGNLLHSLWGCPGLTSLCSRVFQLISSCTGILAKPHPAMALLNLGIDHYPVSQQPYPVGGLHTFSQELEFIHLIQSLRGSEYGQL